MLPRAARENEAAQDDLIAKTLRGTRAAWRAMSGRNWERAWLGDVGPRVIEVVTTGQEAAAAQAEAYTAAVLAELGMDASSPNILDLTSLAGVAGDGREVSSLLYGSVIRAAKAQYESPLVERGPAPAAAGALDAAQEWMDGVVATLMADAARAAEAVSLAQRPWVEGYVRMIEPGACSRCVILAGRFYLYNQGFDRHPECRCVHIPTSENTADNLLTNPNRYFDSLPKAEQDRVFTPAGAEAVRLGADISQVVNARRGMNTAQQNPRGWIPKGRMEAVRMFGRDVFVTTEGVTKRGVYGKARGSKPVRLMPESIIELATSREDAIRLLRIYGYLK